MASFVYIDETGTNARQPFLIVAAVVVEEEVVQPLAHALRRVAMTHLGWLSADFEFHGRELWHGDKHWAGKQPAELIAAYEAALSLLTDFDIWVAHATINKPALTARHGGTTDRNAYRLALQFLLEKVDGIPGSKVLVADEAKEQELHAIKMVADMQDWGGGEVPGRQLRTVIDSLHFVSSHASPGVQMADLVAFVLQRSRHFERHPDAQAALARLRVIVTNRTLTWREPWPLGTPGPTST